MADATKNASINGGSLISELKSLFSLSRTKKTATFAYGLIFVFIAFTVFLAFSPSTNSSSPWFTNIFSTSFSSGNSGSSSTSSTTILPDESSRSQFSSIFSFFFPNSSQPVPNFAPLPSPRNNTTRSQNTTAPSPTSQNTTIQSPISNKEPSTAKNQTHNLNSSQPVPNFAPPPSPRNKTTRSQNTTAQSPTSQNTTLQSPISNKEPSTAKNQTHNLDLHDKVGVFTPNQSTSGPPKSPVTVNQTSNSVPKSSNNRKNTTGNGGERVSEKGVISNSSSSLLKKKSNGTNTSVSVKKRSENLMESLMNCNLYDGEWVRDDSYPLYKPGSCSLIDEQFNCILNGRPDNTFDKLKWKPKGCTIPRLNGSHMLELLRGKRLVFVGDSLNRNMWESLICVLRNSVKDQSKVYEASGRIHFRAEASYSFVFKDYDCTVEFFVCPFLVQEWEISEKNGTKKETLRLDIIGRSAGQYKNADIIIFNTGHWWTHEKTSLGKDYYQEGSHVYSDLNVLEAFRKALTTWGRWVDANINPMKTQVLFRGYSATHFSGGQWNSGGQCDHETEPIKNKTYLSPYPSKMAILESVMKGMKIHVSYLNITRMTDYRKDGHPSIYRKQNLSKEERRSSLRFQDCSHWCLPGVPDTWNELLYAELLIKQYQKKKQQKIP